MTTNNTLGEFIFRDIEKNEYLNKIYNSLLYNRYAQVFSLELDNPEGININDALRFADILSQSTDSEKAEQHHSIAQEIAVLLMLQYPEDEGVRHAVGAILSNAKNFIGVKKASPDFCSFDTIEQICIEAEKENLRIPNTDDDHFLTTQKVIYDHMSGSGSFSYSGPTSMGKSFVMQTFIRVKINEDAGYNFAILVPTKALISEVSRGMIDKLKNLLSDKKYRVVTTTGMSVQNENNLHYIFVMTPERLMYQLINTPDLFIDYVFIDEAQNISEQDGRSTYYYQIVNMLCSQAKQPHIIFASPNIPNPSVYMSLLPGASQNDDELSFAFSPVSQEKYLIDIQAHKIGYYNGLSDSLHTFESSSDADFYRYIMELGNSKKNLVYVNSTVNVVTHARNYAALLPELHDSDLAELSNEIKEQIHEDFYLVELVKKGVAFHNGNLPIWLRDRIEELFEKPDGGLHTIFCTSTLLEGINLPADNLFVTDCTNGSHNLTAVEFRNLIGRVGRIQYGLYGNVFLVCLPNTKVSSSVYRELLHKPVEPQHLSIIALTPEEKAYIADHLKQYDTKLPKMDSQSSEAYALMRKTANILLRDIVTGRSSSIMHDFSGLFSAEEIDKIRFYYTTLYYQPDDDINVSVDQISNIRTAVQGGLSYPVVGFNGYVDYNLVVEFLEKMCDLFDWDTYELDTLGKRNDKGEHRYLRYIAVILKKWFEGNGIPNLIRNEMDYHIGKTIYVDGQEVPFDICNQRHENIVIGKLLKTVNNILLFKLSCYFMRISAELKSFNNIDALTNDWSEFIEYGTTNWKRIVLQKYGFSAESATYIEQNAHLYLSGSKSPLKINQTILRCTRTTVRKEAERIRYNMPEVFF